MDYFRIDRLLTVYFFFPLMQIKSHGEEKKVAILSYHSISEYGENRASRYYETTTSPKVFGSHMRYLYENGFSVVGLGDFLQHSGNERSWDNKIVILSFDDGFADFYTEALPILSRYNFPATVFLPTKFIGNNRRTFNGRDYLSWGEVRESQEEGIEFGSHTVNHLRLWSLAKKDLLYELKRSKEIIDNETGRAVESLSYPYAFPEHNKKFIRHLHTVLKTCGYKNAVTSIIGRVTGTDNRYLLKRIPVNSHDDLSFYRAKIGGGYNWIRSFQYMNKRLDGKPVKLARMLSRSAS